MILLPFGTDTPFQKTPRVTFALMIINLAFYIFGFFYGWLTGFGWFGGSLAMMLDFGYVPAHPRFYTLLTSMFVHAGLFHLVFNMWFFFLFAPNIEERLGHLRFALLYVSGGIISTLGHAYFATGYDATQPLVGASGAIYCTMGAYFIFLPFSDIKCWYFIIFTFHSGIFNLAALFLLPFRVLIDLFLGYLATQNAKTFGSSGAGTAFLAHVCGFFWGAGVGLILHGIKSFTSEDEQEREAAKSESLRREEEEIPTYAKLLAATDRAALRPQEPQIRQNFGRLVFLGKLEEVEEEYRAYLSLFGEQAFDVQSQFDLARLLLARNSLELGVKAIDQMMRHYPKDARTDRLLMQAGRQLMNSPEYLSKARQYVERYNAGDRLNRETLEARELLDAINRRMGVEPATFGSAEIAVPSGALPPPPPPPPPSAFPDPVGAAEKSQQRAEVENLPPPPPHELDLFGDSTPQASDIPAISHPPRSISPETPHAENRGPDHYLGEWERERLEMEIKSGAGGKPETTGEKKSQVRQPYAVSMKYPSPPLSHPNLGPAPSKPAPDDDATPPPRSPEDTGPITGRQFPPEARFTVILAPGKPVSLAATVKEMRAFLDRSDLEAENFVRAHKGLLAPDLDQETATRLVLKLLSAGQECRAIWQSPLLSFPAPEELIRLRLMPEAAEFRSERQTVSVPLRGVKLLSAGAVQLAPSPASPKNVLDFFTTHPQGWFRLWENTFNFRTIAELDATEPGRQLLQLIRIVLSKCAKARKTGPVAQMIGDKLDDPPLIFNNLMEFEAFSRWNLLALFGQRA